MAKKNSIYFKKVIVDGGVFAAPVYDTDREKFDKIKGGFLAEIQVHRNLGHHRKFFAVAGTCVENGILDRMDKIDSLVLEMLRRRFADDVYTLVYIAKWLFLPHERILNPDGTVAETVASISFAEMDQLEFEEFYLKSLIFFAETLGCNVADLDQGAA